MLTNDDIAARTARAVAAATAAGRDLGLTVHEPRVLYDVFSVIVHLDPEPVVVRVPTVLPRYSRENPDGQLAQQRKEIAVTSWLAERSFPVVAPSPLVPAEPVRRDGFSMTFWQFVKQDKDIEPNYVRGAELTAGLHAALRDYPGELDFLPWVNQFIPDSLDEIARDPGPLSPDDLARAWREWEAIEPIVSSPEGLRAAFGSVEVTPIHGDAPYYNIITTPDGELFADFELVSLGPAELDIAAAGPECCAAYNAAAERLSLRRLEDEPLAIMGSVGMLMAVCCLAMAPELPMLFDGLSDAIDHWRSLPPAG